MKLLIEDAFLIRGRGLIVAVTIPLPNVISAGDIVEVEGEEESLRVIFVETGKVLTSPPKDLLKVGIGLGEGKHDKEFYVGKYLIKK